jgi:hypothetical protein
VSELLQILHQASSNERLFAVDFRIDEAWTKDAADYWYFELFLRASGEAIGKRLGILSLQDRSIAGKTDISVYTGGDVGVALAQGDAVVCKTTRTGTPADLVAPGFFVDWAAVSN